MSKRSPFQLLLLTAKGVAMGAADVVPGVSGGTIAFISGIYEELITSISNVNLAALKVLKNNGLGAFWKHINGTFFIFLFAGIGISIISLAKAVSHLLENYPVLIWSFFFGLILASVYLIAKTITKWSAAIITVLIIGIAVAFYITTINSVANIESKWYLVFSGALAICAMILPGISGAFILLLLGSYNRVLDAVTEREFTLIALFASGCIIGLLSFARILKFLFSKYKQLTIAVLSGFMIGSLNKVWPWKETVSERENSHGELVPFIQANVLPQDYAQPNQIWLALTCCAGGFLIIFVLQKFAPKQT